MYAWENGLSRPYLTSSSHRVAAFSKVINAVRLQEVEFLLKSNYIKGFSSKHLYVPV